MNDDLPLPERILGLLEILKDKFNFESKSYNMDEANTKEFNSLWQSIIKDLIRSPGTLIFIKNINDRENTQTMINLIWETLDSEEIFNEMTGGGYDGFLVDMISDYIDRVKLLKPTLITINPHKLEFTRYFDEAMKTWLYGLNCSAMIICCSIIEDMIKTELQKIDEALILSLYGGKKGIKVKDLKELIFTAYKHHIININEKKIANNIRKLRNNAVHNLEKVSDKEIYQAIIETKELVEKILNNFNKS